MSQKPKNWPPSLPYLTAPIYSKALSPSALTALRTKPPSAAEVNSTKGPSPLVKITPISIPSHPANGQSGLFATRDLKPGTFVLVYMGEIHGPPPSASPPKEGVPAEAVDVPADPHASSDYDLSLDRFEGIGVDAARMGNEARFVNDYRGVKDRANAEFREVWDVRRGERAMGVWVLAEGKGKAGGNAKGIRRGEEILVSYGRGFWGARKE